MSSGAAAATRPRFATERGTLRLFRARGAPAGARHRQAQARGAALPRLVLPLPVLPVLCYRLGGGFPARRRSGFRPARRKRAGLTTEKRRNRRFRAQTRRGNSAKHLLSEKRSAARQLHAQTRLRTGGRGLAAAAAAAAYCATAAAVPPPDEHTDMQLRSFLFSPFFTVSPKFSRSLSRSLYF